MKKTLIIPTLALVCLMVASCCGGAAQKEGTECAAADSCKASSMKIITARKFIKADKVAEFIEFSKEQIEKSRAEEGCISYTLYQDPYDSTQFIFVEQWKDQAAIDFHFSTDHFKQAGTRGGDFEAAPMELTIFDACPVK